MKTRPGPPEVLRLEDVEKPVPGPDDVLVRVRATTVTQGDVITRTLPSVMLAIMRITMGMHSKRIPGTELAGEIEAVGANVRRFEPGEAVFGSTGLTSAGSYAEYVCLPRPAMLTRKPANLDFEQAAALPVGAMTAMHFLKPVGISPGDRVLVHGASGSVGTYAVQIARHLGARVTGVCGTRNLELVRSLGAGRVIDYTADDWTAEDIAYDCVFDAAGKTSLAESRPVLAPTGSFVSVRKGLARERLDYLEEIARLAEAGEIMPVIDRRYTLEQMAEAHGYVQTGHKVGNVVVTVAS